jgi:hypothetical protein
MGRVSLSVLRRQRQTIIIWVIAALVVPLFLGLLPQAAPSPAAILERDLAQSVCDQSDQQGQVPSPLHQGDHGSCVLCVFGCGVAAPDESQSRVTAAARPESGEAAHAPVLAFDHASQPVLPDGSPPRAPPHQIS